MNVIEASNGVRYLKSEKLHCPHGFSTRIGGVSALPHTSSLNLAFGRGDSDITVLENLSRFCEAVGIEQCNVVSAPQIHSADVRLLTASDRGKGYFSTAEFACDGYVTAESSVAPGVKTADCVPVLLAAENTEGRVFAVAALHAGWRGTASGIVTVGVQKLISLGAVPERIFAAIGPAIGGCCFEVDADCKNTITCQLGTFCEEYIAKKCEKYFPDLKAINAALLIKSGVPAENTDICGLCTCCDTDVFYSHRATAGMRGTMLSVISVS